MFPLLLTTPGARARSRGGAGGNRKQKIRRKQCSGKIFKKNLQVHEFKSEKKHISRRKKNTIEIQFRHDSAPTFFYTFKNKKTPDKKHTLVPGIQQRCFAAVCSLNGESPLVFPDEFERVLPLLLTPPGERGAGGLCSRLCSIVMHGRSRMTIWYRPSHPYDVRTEHVRFSPTRQALLAPSAKRREVFGESHEG